VHAATLRPPRKYPHARAPHHVPEDWADSYAGPVSDDYAASGDEFNGTIESVRLDAGDDSHDHLADPAHKMHIAMVRQ
jgi:hypothetical protein